jgi:hypothetical protein
MKKSVIIGLAVLLLTLFSSTAYCTEGPSQTIVFPLICEVPSVKTLPLAPEHLDMVLNLANVTNVDTYVSAIVSNFRSRFEYDYSVHLSPYDMSRETCRGIVNAIFPTSGQSDMIQTIGGKQYYVGYIEYDGDVADPASSAQLIGWAEIETLSTLIAGGSPKKLQIWEKLYTDTGFNGVPDFYEDVNAATAITGTVGNGISWIINTNQTLMPRYRIANSDPDTYNWWIIMTPSDALTTPYSSCTRRLECFMCDENENCLSENIPLPNQVNIINVADWVPAALFPAATYPKSGFARCEVTMEGFSSTSTGSNPCGNAGNEQYLGWSYQHTLGSFNLETALILPMHRYVGGFPIP